MGFPIIKCAFSYKLCYYNKKEGILYTLIVLIIVLISIIALGALYTVFKSKINFYITGLDSGFSLTDLQVLWEAAQICDLDMPTSLFFSLPSLTKCMTQISNRTSTDDSARIQLLMSKLFNYRTKIQNESDDKKGLTNTHSLEKGQPLRIILPGKGVFSSEIVNNGSMIVINVPRQKELIPYTAEEWVNKVISVYLWRRGDARYVFDTTVVQCGVFLGKSAHYSTKIPFILFILIDYFTFVNTPKKHFNSFYSHNNPKLSK